ncbi:unnamed protein product [marine sediment metagenome]|uniref:Uncharacterized protein n=1 Tax=marine sediment metagenome TaxID=412755 RepID=X0SR71_9ZZZZ
MRLIKRITADIRGPDMTEQSAENMVNEELTKLQTNEGGTRNKVEIKDISEATKDSGIMVFIVLYEDPGLDTKSEG